MLILLLTTSLSIFVAESSPFHHFMPVEIIGGVKESPQPQSYLPGPVNTLKSAISIRLILRVIVTGNCFYSRNLLQIFGLLELTPIGFNSKASTNH